MSEYDSEPVPGLPGLLPEGETILWQGSPSWRQLMQHALHIRLAALYFAVIVGWALIDGDMSTAAGVTLLGLAVIAMLAGFAWGVARTTIYTLTNRRIVLRIGVALNKCINLPLTEIAEAHLKLLGEGHGSIVLSLKGAPRLGYLMLWPHARSLRIARPQPMLRAVPDAQAAAETLLRAAQRVQPVAPAMAAPATGAEPAHQPLRPGLAGVAA